MSPKFPIIRHKMMNDASGRICIVDIRIENTNRLDKYPPDGRKCVFRVVREKAAGNNDFELVLLIDNHEPFGFHYHSGLPKVHNSRVSIHAWSWETAWVIFDKKMLELLNEKA